MVKKKIEAMSSLNKIISELQEHEKRLDQVQRKKESLDNLPESADKTIAAAINQTNLKLTSAQAEMSMAKDLMKTCSFEQ